MPVIAANTSQLIYFLLLTLSPLTLLAEEPGGGTPLVTVPAPLENISRAAAVFVVMFILCFTMLLSQSIVSPSKGRGAIKEGKLMTSLQALLYTQCQLCP